MERYSLFLGRKNPQCENDYIIKYNLQIQCDPHQITIDIFHTTRTKNFTVCVETKDPKQKSSLEREKQEPKESGTLTADYSASFSNQNTVLAQKQKYTE